MAPRWRGFSRFRCPKGSEVYGVPQARGTLLGFAVRRIIGAPLFMETTISSKHCAWQRGSLQVYVNLKPYTLNSKTLNPKPTTLNPSPNRVLTRDAIAARADVPCPLWRKNRATLDIPMLLYTLDPNQKGSAGFLGPLKPEP